MIIPIRCFTCGKVMADKYDYYVKEVHKLSEATQQPQTLQKELKNFDTLQTKEILDSLGLTRYCCRRHMLTTVDLMDKI